MLTSYNGSQDYPSSAQCHGSYCRRSRQLSRAAAESVRLFPEDSRYLIHGQTSKPSGERLLVAIAGVPASGKSTLAELVVAKANTLLAADNAMSSTSAILVG